MTDAVEQAEPAPEARASSAPSIRDAVQFAQALALAAVAVGLFMIAGKLDEIAQVIGRVPSPDVSGIEAELKRSNDIADREARLQSARRFGY